MFSKTNKDSHESDQGRTEMMRTGFVGLGAMGLPMALNLANAGHDVIVHDINPASLEKACAHDRIEAASSPADVARGADVIFSCLPDNAVVEATYLGEGGIGQGVDAGKITVDCSTISPAVTRAVAKEFATSGVHHVDAAMLGSVPQATSGEIGFVVGGERAAVDRVEPLLDILGRFVKYAGPSGAGHQIKLVHQTLVAINAVAVAETMALCEATGTDLDCFYDVVCNAGGFAYSRYFENRVPRMRDGDFSALFMLRFMLKDARLASGLAGESGSSVPVLAQAIALLENADAAGWGDEDFSAVAHVYDRAANP